MSLIATLPWYDLPAAQPQLDRFWRALHQALCQAEPALQGRLPNRLERHTELTRLWQKPQLILSQCCGPDLFTPQTADLLPIGRPVFSNLDCAPGCYFSHIVSSTAAVPHRPRVVINSPTSRSGCFALFEWLSQAKIDPASIAVSGSHQESLTWLLQGKADIAAIDAQSWGYLATQELPIIDRSKAAPAPPYVMHRDSPVSVDVMAASLAQAIKYNGNAVGISDLLPASRELYQPLIEPPIRPVQMAERSRPESVQSPVPA